MDDSSTVAITDDVLAWYSSRGPSLIDYVVKLEKDLSIVGHLSYAAFVGPLILLSLFALRTDNLLFHRIFVLVLVELSIVRPYSLNILYNPSTYLLKKHKTTL